MRGQGLGEERRAQDPIITFADMFLNYQTTLVMPFKHHLLKFHHLLLVPSWKPNLYYMGFWGTSYIQAILLPPQCPIEECPRSECGQ
jgi:hypothetical protein